MVNNRKKWSRPQLIVLGRGTPEENVLAGCKNAKRTAATGILNSCRKGGGCAGGKCSVIAKTT